MPSKQYVARETPIIWSDSSNSVLAMTLRNLSAGAGRIGASKDWGDASTPQWFIWRLTVQFATAPVIGEVIDIYLSWYDGFQSDGELGVADAAVDSNSLKNCKRIGTLIVTSTAINHDMTASGICRIPTRFVMPVIFNSTADNLKDTADVSEFVLTPIPPETQ